MELMFGSYFIASVCGNMRISLTSAHTCHMGVVKVPGFDLRPYLVKTTVLSLFMRRTLIEVFDSKDDLRRGDKTPVPLSHVPLSSKKDFIQTA